MEKEHSLVGERTKKRFRVGDTAKVRIENVDIERRQIDMALEGDARDKAQARKSGIWRKNKLPH
ncbi:MAG: hypothetical protein A3D30_00440 [Deltaproteobacteria bacterium RIFCSPHIGHO2_02_FULL_43_33]|nr:MAG: hypothetical protein A3D30_00440 [Deltaproteobacteria bacterium RIFCSPHIGHO2_02_FULL_43_33]